MARTQITDTSHGPGQPLSQWDRVRAFGLTLAKTERMSPQELDAYQAPLLSPLLLHARNTTKFYKDRFDFDIRSIESIRSNWSRIPPLTRADIMKNRLKLTSRKSSPDLGPVIEGETSGSTGVPITFKRNAAADVASLAFTERLYRWWSVDGSKSLALIAPDRAGQAKPPEGQTTLGWHSSNPNGQRHVIGLETDTDTHLNWLVARRPNYLGTYPAILKELARSARKRGIELKPALLFSFATVLDEETRELCKAAFGAEIADTYGTQETGHIAAQCRACGEYHLSVEASVIEILRSDGSPAAPGEIGRVVVTPLYNFAMPMIRYDLGDMAEVGTARPACGRGLPTLRRILGRYRNMFRYRDGTTAWPVSAKFNLTDFIAPKQFQVVQTDFEAIEIRYVPDEEAADRPIDLAGLTERVRAVLRQPVNVSVRRVPQIERSRSGKYEDCLSLVAIDGASSASPQAGV